MGLSLCFYEKCIPYYTKIIINCLAGYTFSSKNRANVQKYTFFVHHGIQKNTENVYHGIQIL